MNKENFKNLEKQINERYGITSKIVKIEITNDDPLYPVNAIVYMTIEKDGRIFDVVMHHIKKQEDIITELDKVWKEDNNE